jgi:hypothetical protein
MAGFFANVTQMAIPLTQDRDPTLRDLRAQKNAYFHSLGRLGE